MVCGLCRAREKGRFIFCVKEGRCQRRVDIVRWYGLQEGSIRGTNNLAIETWQYRAFPNQVGIGSVEDSSSPLYFYYS